MQLRWTSAVVCDVLKAAFHRGRGVRTLQGPARAATAQGLLTSMSLGFGAITGTLVGGLLLDHIGAVGIFRVAGAGMLVACVSYRCSMRVIRPT